MKIEIHVTTTKTEDEAIANVISKSKEMWESFLHVKVGKATVEEVMSSVSDMFTKGFVGLAGEKYKYDREDGASNAFRRVTIDVPEAVVTGHAGLAATAFGQIKKRVAPYVLPIIENAADIAREYESGKEALIAENSVTPQYGYMIVERHVDGYIGAVLVKRDSDDTVIIPVDKFFCGKCEFNDAFDKIVKGMINEDDRERKIVWLERGADMMQAYEKMKESATARWNNWRQFYVIKVDVKDKTVPAVIAKWPDSSVSLETATDGVWQATGDRARRGAYKVVKGPFQSLKDANKEFDIINEFRLGG